MSETIELPNLAPASSASEDVRDSTTSSDVPRNNAARSASLEETSPPKITHITIAVGRWLFGHYGSLMAWTCTFLGLLIAILALLSSFRSETLSRKALELAEWTAKVDFLEQCERIMVCMPHGRAQNRRHTLTRKSLGLECLLA